MGWVWCLHGRSYLDAQLGRYNSPSQTFYLCPLHGNTLLDQVCFLRDACGYNKGRLADKTLAQSRAEGWETFISENLQHQSNAAGDYYRFQYHLTLILCAPKLLFASCPSLCIFFFYFYSALLHFFFFFIFTSRKYCAPDVASAWSHLLWDREVWAGGQLNIEAFQLELAMVCDMGCNLSLCHNPTILATSRIPKLNSTALTPSSSVDSCWSSDATALPAQTPNSDLSQVFYCLHKNLTTAFFLLFLLNSLFTALAVWAFHHNSGERKEMARKRFIATRI